MTGYIQDQATVEDIAHERATYGPVADTLRQLAAASIRTTVDPEIAHQAHTKLTEALRLLTSSLGDASYGVRYSPSGGRPWGNAVVGVRNPVAPPLEIRYEDGVALAEVTLGPQYEGPPALVHGGVSALLLDQMLGEAAALNGTPGMTGTLTVKYRRGTPLGELSLRSWVDRTEGYKTYAVGTLSDAEGVCVEAEGVFILPRWARAEGMTKPTRFE